MRLSMTAAFAAAIMCSTLAGCQTTKEAEGIQSGTGSIEWTAERRAGHRLEGGAPSPVITLDGPPPSGAVTLKIAMTDLDNPGWNHGGGSVDVATLDGTVIPEGAVKGNYYGPGGGMRRPTLNNRYEFRISAVDAGGTTLAKWRIVERCCADMGF